MARIPPASPAVYNPRNRRVSDHGILKKQEGLMGGAIDNKRRRLYFWSDPKQHLLIYDIAANRVLLFCLEAAQEWERTSLHQGAKC